MTGMKWSRMSIAAFFVPLLTGCSTVVSCLLRYTRTATHRTHCNTLDMLQQAEYWGIYTLGVQLLSLAFQNALYMHVHCNTPNTLQHIKCVATHRIDCKLQHTEYTATHWIHGNTSHTLKHNEHAARHRIHCNTPNMLQHIKYVATQRTHCNAPNTLQNTEYSAANQIRCNTTNTL